MVTSGNKTAIRLATTWKTAESAVNATARQAVQAAVATGPTEPPAIYPLDAGFLGGDSPAIPSAPLVEGLRMTETTGATQSVGSGGLEMVVV